MTDPPPTQEKSLRDLMEEIAVYQDSEIAPERKIAELALQELLVTYGRLLWALVHDRVGDSEEEDWGTLNLDRDELYSQLLLRIWKYSASFDPKGDDPEGHRKQFVSWAGTILGNIVNDIIAAVMMDRDQLNYLEEIWTNAFAGEDEASERIRQVKEVLEEMPPEDAEVLRWSAPLIPLDGSPMQPDPAEREAICQQLGVTPEGLRQRRSRALKKLKTALLRLEH